MSITPTPEPKYAAAWEPFIPYGDPASCPPDLKPGLDALVAKVGFMSNSMKLYLHNPGVLRAITAMGAGITSNDDGALDRTLKRKLAVICSATNGCVYCTAHQCDFLTRPPAGGGEGWGIDADEVYAMIAGTEVPANEMERLCFEFARAASSDAAGVTDELRSRLARGLTPAQVVELAAVVGYWKFLNTLHDSLNIPPEPQNIRFTGVLDAYGKKESVT